MKYSNVIDTTTDVALTSINFGLTVGTALSWNEYFKALVSRFVKTGSGSQYLLMYALVMTIVTTAVMIGTRMLTRKILKEEKGDKEE